MLSAAWYLSRGFGATFRRSAREAASVAGCETACTGLAGKPSPGSFSSPPALSSRPHVASKSCRGPSCQWHGVSPGNAQRDAPRVAGPRRDPRLAYTKLVDPKITRRSLVRRATGKDGDVLGRPDLRLLAHPLDPHALDPSAGAAVKPAPLPSEPLARRSRGLNRQTSTARAKYTEITSDRTTTNKRHSQKPGTAPIPQASHAA